VELKLSLRAWGWRRVQPMRVWCWLSKQPWTAAAGRFRFSGQSGPGDGVDLGDDVNAESFVDDVEDGLGDLAEDASDAGEGFVDAVEEFVDDAEETKEDAEEDFEDATGLDLPW
jgi:hypothetical protein